MCTWWIRKWRRTPMLRYSGSLRSFRISSSPPHCQWTRNFHATSLRKLWRSKMTICRSKRAQLPWMNCGATTVWRKIRAMRTWWISKRRISACSWVGSSWIYSKPSKIHHGPTSTTCRHSIRTCLRMFWCKKRVITSTKWWRWSVCRRNFRRSSWYPNQCSAWSISQHIAQSVQLHRIFTTIKKRLRNKTTERVDRDQ